MDTYIVDIMIVMQKYEIYVIPFLSIYTMSILITSLFFYYINVNTYIIFFIIIIEEYLQSAHCTIIKFDHEVHLLCIFTRERKKTYPLIEFKLI